MRRFRRVRALAILLTGPTGFLVAAGLAAVVCLSHSRASILSAQQLPRPTFRTGVEYVEVDAHVVDGKGHPVGSLTKDDFKVFEDGKEMVVEGFEAIDIPIAVSSPPEKYEIEEAVTVPADTTVTIDLPPADEGRVFVIVLDDRLIDHQRTLKTITIATTFINTFMGPHDLAAVVSTSGRMDASQTFTSDKAKLLKATQRFMGNKPESLVLLGLQRSNLSGAAAEKMFETLESMRFVQTVVTQLAAIQGRSKSMLLISEGADMTDGFDPSVDLILLQEKDMIAAATRGNVTIHSVDPRGLYAYDELTAFGGSYPAALAEARGVASARESGGVAGGSDAPVGVAAMSAAVKAFKTEVDRGQMTLRGISASTNGLTIINSNKFDDGFGRILAQQSTYYLLSYRSTNERRQGKFRKIEVKVPSGRGLKVQARRGYTEEKN